MSNPMKKIILSLAIVALLMSAYPANIGFALESQDKAKKSRVIESFFIPEMPARVDAAEIVEGSVLGTDVKYTITNLTKERVSSISLVAMVFGNDGEFIRSEGLSYSEDLSPSESRESLGNYLEKEVNLEERVIIAIYAIVGETGTWEVSLNQLEVALKSHALDQYYEKLSVTHDTNLVLSEDDKAELYRMTLEAVLKDKWVTKYLSIEDAQNIVLSTQEIGPRLVPKIDGVNILVMTPEEIGKKRMLDGNFGYFYFYPMSIEGARVQVAIMYRKDKQVGQNAYTPCCGTVDVVFHKENGEWVEKTSRGARI